MAGLMSIVFALLAGACIAEAKSSFRRNSAELQESDLRSELATLLGHGDASKSERLDWLQEQLRPMYVALPKAADGSLDQGVVRYALHRFFVQRHGWHVKGLEAAGAEKWGDASATDMFEGRVPDYVLELVRQRFNGVNMGLPDLAVLAATLEDLIHGEAIQKLKAAYLAQNVSVDDVLTQEMEDRIVSTYMLFHVKPHPNYTMMSTARLNRVISKASKFLPDWENTLLWVQDIKHTMDHEQLSDRNPFNGPTEWHNFEAIARLVEEVGEEYGQYQNIECRTLKNSLLDLEDNENGRVRLSKFYAHAVDGVSSHFGERPDYLRHLGALDETDPERPSVIVTNYLYAKSNCLATSGFYSVCCINQCEALMARLERSINGPSAPAQFIADMVSDMSSETIIAPRNLSSSLRLRLADISERHGGGIPIHGRLFAQWMHHAFPNECPYPHAPGALDKPMTAAEWKLSVGLESARASKEDMQFFVDAGAQVPDIDVSLAAESLPWTEEEELVATLVPTAAVSSLATQVSTLFRLAVLFAAMCSAVVGMARMARAPTATLPLHKAGKSSNSAWSFVWPRAQKAHYV